MTNTYLNPKKWFKLCYKISDSTQKKVQYLGIPGVFPWVGDARPSLKGDLELNKGVGNSRFTAVQMENSMNKYKHKLCFTNSQV